jgi:hypothetical protein
VPEGLESWGDAQSEYEQLHERSVKHDSLQEKAKYLMLVDTRGV